ncbi:aspartyl protease family protein [Flavobacterium rhizosphaerae]|uniref:Aspartyl protease family protein n=1 Tax=Flavobacterium rhizosphaerae TaxID=3163298 RepID=A0ABW8YZE3_9FLAO
MKIYNLLLLYLLTCWGASAQPDSYTAFKTETDWAATGFYYEIPFEYKQNAIIIKADIGGTLYDFILDTGAGLVISDEIARENNLSVVSQRTIAGANNLRQKVKVVKIDSLKIGKLTFRDYDADAMDYIDSGLTECTVGNGGIIGYKIMQNAAWQINYKKGTISIADGVVGMPNLSKAVRLPLEIKNSIPFVDIKINGKKERVVFDLGYFGSLLLNKKGFKRYKNLHYVTIEGSYSEGISGRKKDTFKIYKADTVNLGTASYTNKAFAVSDQIVFSLLGNKLIKDFIVTIDYKGSSIYLTPYVDASLDKGYTDFDITLSYDDNKFIIETIIENSESEKMGLNTGDEVVAINGKPIECHNTCDCQDYFFNLLHNSEELKITVLKEGMPKEYTLKKNKIF